MLEGFFTVWRPGLGEGVVFIERQARWW